MFTCESGSLEAFGHEIEIEMMDKKIKEEEERKSKQTCQDLC